MGVLGHWDTFLYDTPLGFPPINIAANQQILTIDTFAYSIQRRYLRIEQ